MTKEQAIKKYNLEKIIKNCFDEKIDYELYQNEKFDGNTKYVYTLDNQMSHELDNGKIYFLTIEKFDYNNWILIKKTNVFRPKMTTKIYQIEE